MANNKFYTCEKVINGVKYVAQFNGISAALRAIDESYIDDSKNISMEKLSEYLFENVIVEPANLTADDFDNMKDFNDVVAFARQVMQGDFRKKENEGGTEKGSKK